MKKAKKTKRLKQSLRGRIVRHQMRNKNNVYNSNYEKIKAVKTVPKKLRIMTKNNNPKYQQRIKNLNQPRLMRNKKKSIVPTKKPKRKLSPR